MIGVSSEPGCVLAISTSAPLAMGSSCLKAATSGNRLRRRVDGMRA
jgi:hypothetical protein